MPKSVSFTLTRSEIFPEVGVSRSLLGGRCSMSTFSGFTSRWITPSACACESAASTSIAIAAAISGGSGARSFKSLRSVAPRTSSTTRNFSASSADETSKTSTMFGCRSLATACASTTKRCATSADSRKCGWMTFTATSRARRVSCARYTVAIPP